MQKLSSSVLVTKSPKSYPALSRWHIWMGLRKGTGWFRTQIPEESRDHQRQVDAMSARGGSQHCGRWATDHLQGAHNIARNQGLRLQTPCWWVLHSGATMNLFISARTSSWLHHWNAIVRGCVRLSRPKCCRGHQSSSAGESVVVVGAISTRCGSELLQRLMSQFMVTARRVDVAVAWSWHKVIVSSGKISVVFPRFLCVCLSLFQTIILNGMFPRIVRYAIGCYSIEFEKKVSSSWCLCAPGTKTLIGVFVWLFWRDLPVKRQVWVPTWVKSTVPRTLQFPPLPSLAAPTSWVRSRGRPLTFQFSLFISWSAACKNQIQLYWGNWKVSLWLSFCWHSWRGPSRGSGWCGKQPWGWLRPPDICRCQDCSKWWPTLWAFGLWLSTIWKRDRKKTPETIKRYSMTLCFNSTLFTMCCYTDSLCLEER